MVEEKRMPAGHLYRGSVSLTFTDGVCYNPDLFGSSSRSLAYIVGVNISAATNGVLWSYVAGPDGIRLQLYDTSGNPASGTVTRTVGIYYIKQSELATLSNEVMVL